MSSRQLNFYMTSEDQMDFETALRSVTSMDVLSSGGEQPDVRCLPSTMVLDPGKERLKVYLAPRSTSLAISVRTSGKFHIIDSRQSEVIEFTRCHQTENRIGRGRLYAVTGFYDQGELRRKDKEFLKWVDVVFRVARRNLTKEKDSFLYFGKNALLLKAGNFEFADF